MSSEPIIVADASPMLRAALDLAESAGVLIALAHEPLGLGCTCGKAECGSPGKHPRGDEWQLRASSDPVEIVAAFAKWPSSNIGIATGRASGVVVLDVDGAAGEASLAQYPALPMAPEVRTSRGRHVYFAAPDMPLRNRAGAKGRGLGAGLDLRADGGFVIVPPSKHVSGLPYAWTAGRALGAFAAPATPEWIIERATDRPVIVAMATALVPRDSPLNGSRVERWADAALRREVAAVAGAEPGSRNTTLNTSAFNLGTLCAGGALEAAEVKFALLNAAMSVGLSELEAEKTVRSGFAAGFKKDARSAPTRELTKPGYVGGAHTTLLTLRKAPSAGVSDSPPPAAAPVPASSAMVPRYTTEQLFSALPAQRWAVPGLQIGPGRPTLIAGYGASAKTISVQALALALASGTPIWNRFACTPMTVLHVDYEQGYYATAKRYQRLALGYGIDPKELGGRLHYVEMPTVYLDRRADEAEWMAACNGVDLIIVDALRGAAPHTDENDSGFRAAIDALTRCSQKTGVSVLILHHAGKPKRDGHGDNRTVARGSSAIFDACGCVLNFTAQPGSNARLVTQVKTPAEAEGATLEPFELVVEDVPIGGLATGGARVSWRACVPVDESDAALGRFERDAALMFKAVRRDPHGQSTNQIVAGCGLGRARAIDVLRSLADSGRLELVKGPNRAKVYRLPEKEGV